MHSELGFGGLALLGLSLGIQLAKADAEKPTTAAQVKVLVAYYSLTGNTEKMAGGVVAGSSVCLEPTATLKKVDEVAKEDLESADAIILDCPTYYGNIPGKMKVVLDDWAWKMKVEFTDKVGGAFSTGGGQVGASRKGGGDRDETFSHPQASSEPFISRRSRSHSFGRFRP